MTYYLKYPDFAVKSLNPDDTSASGGIDMKITGMLPPLWIKYPYLTKNSSVWNEDEQAEYLREFSTWKSNLSDEVKNAYDTFFPEPVCWNDSDKNTMTAGKLTVFKWSEHDDPDMIDFEKHRPFIFFENIPEREKNVTKNCFSNWYLDDFRVNDRQYSCVEQFMMEKKALLFRDSETAALIMDEKDPQKIKKLGRGIKNFDDTLWGHFKSRIVLTACWFKFAGSSDLRNYILSTGNSLPVEMNPGDRIWGSSLSIDDPDRDDPSKWQGSNLLGTILVTVRDELRRVRRNVSYLDDAAGKEM